MKYTRDQLIQWLDKCDYPEGATDIDLSDSSFEYIRTLEDGLKSIAFDKQFIEKRKSELKDSGIVNWNMESAGYMFLKAWYIQAEKANACLESIKEK